MGLFTSFGGVVNITYMHVVMCVAGPIKGLEWWFSYIPRSIFCINVTIQSVSVPKNVIWLRKCNDVSPSSYLRQALIIPGTASQCSLVRTSTAVTLGLLIRL